MSVLPVIPAIRYTSQSSHSHPSHPSHLVIPGADLLLVDVATLHGTWPGIFAQVRGKGLCFDPLHLHVDHWMLYAALPRLGDTKDTNSSFTENGTDFPGF